MKYLSVMFFAILVLVGNCFAAGEFAGLEVYANADPLFYAGKDILKHSRICVWATSGQELGCTLGPKIGAGSLGVGASGGKSETGVSLLYFNFDVKFAWKFRGIYWESQSLYQKGYGKVKDFFYCREVISFLKFPMGLIGENKKVGAKKAQLFWGPFIQLGKMNIFSSNKLCLGINLRDSKEYWAAWLADF